MSDLLGGQQNLVFLKIYVIEAPNLIFVAWHYAREIIKITQSIQIPQKKQLRVTRSDDISFLKIYVMEHPISAC